MIAQLLAALAAHQNVAAVVASHADPDHDGFESQEDCAPRDPTVHPDAVEIEGDGIDSDCNGSDDFAEDGSLIAWFDTSRGREVADLTERRTSFGSWALMPGENSTVHVLGWAFQFTGSDDPSVGLFSVVPVEAVAMDYWMWCLLANEDGGSVIMGPLHPDEDGMVYFTDDFWMDPTGISMSFECEPTGLYPNSPLAFAVGLDTSVSPSETLIAEDATTGERVWVDVRATNGSPFSPDYAVEIRP